MFYQYNHLGSPDYMKIETGIDFSFPAHLHQCFEIIILLSGEMTVTIDNKSFFLKEKQAVLIFPNQIHSLSSTCSEHILCIFSPRLVQAYSNKIYNRIPRDNAFQPDEYLVQVLTHIENSSSSAEKKGLLYLLCAQFDREAEYCEKQTDSKKLLNIIFSFVEDNFNSDCSLSNLSQNVGYDYSYLSRYFKHTTGLSFNSYVTHYRLSYACYLMESTTMPIVQCAYESGFKSLRSFNRSFRENFKITPTQYLKSMNS